MFVLDNPIGADICGMGQVEREQGMRTEKAASGLTSWGVALSAQLFAVAPAITEPFSGYTEDQLPLPQPDPVIQPPGWAFAIWGIIYLWLVAGALYGVLRARHTSDWQAMRPPLIVALLVGAAWLWIANASAIWGTITIFIMAGAAIAALLWSGREDWWWQTAPVGMFAGWLTAASGVSLAVTLAGFGVLGPTAAAIVALIGVITVAVAVLVTRPTAWTYALGAGWALFGVTITALGQDNMVVLVLASAGLAGLAAIAIRGAR